MADGCRVASSDIHLNIDGILQKIVSLFRRKYVGRNGQSCGRKERHRGADGAKVPRDIEVPSRNGKLVVVVVEIGLQGTVSTLPTTRQVHLSPRGTYHNRDDDELDRRNQGQHGANKRPARLALVLATAHDDQEGYDTGETQDSRQRRHESHGPPHVAEVSLAIATQLLIGKGPTRRVVEARAALVQADVLLEPLAAGSRDRVRNPMRDGDGGDCHGRRCGWSAAVCLVPGTCPPHSRRSPDENDVIVDAIGCGPGKYTYRPGRPPGPKSRHKRGSCRGSRFGCGVDGTIRSEERRKGCERNLEGQEQS